MAIIANARAIQHVGLFFDGTLMGKSHNTTIRQFKDAYEKQPYTRARYYQFHELGGSPTARLDPIALPFAPSAAALAMFRGEGGNVRAKREFDEVVKRAVNDVLATPVSAQIDLFGYSRGGIAALYVARKLDYYRRDVRYMALIDPSVTFLADTDVITIPSNVAFAAVAYGDSWDGFRGRRALEQIGADIFIGINPTRLSVEDPSKTKLWEHFEATGHIGVGTNAAVQNWLRVPTEWGWGVPLAPPK
jgi:hypothetical protein